MFKDSLRYLREHQELSQAEVFRRIGIFASSYSRYGCGTNEPNLETLKKLAALFDCTVDYLLEIDGDVADSDKVVDLNYFISNGKFTIDSRFPNDRDHKIINAFINSVFKD